MIKTILGHLHSGVEKLESGHLSPEEMELLVEDAKELYERMIILRYKIYETNVLGVQAPVISASLRQPEIETPIDLFGSIDEPASEPEFVTFASGESEERNEEVFYDENEEQLEDEEEEEQANEDAEAEEEEATEEAASEEEEEANEEEMSEEVAEVEAELEEPAEETTAAQTANWEPEFSGDQPIWMAEMEANIRDNRSVFPLESLIGAFTLNEKLQFINELFDGSSDEFSSNIKQLDQLASMDAARNMLTELSQTFNWDTESEIVEDFIYKICRRYATGA
jgi:chemotaxis protein histidine kinase CheA